MPKTSDLLDPAYPTIVLADPGAENVDGQVDDWLGLSPGYGVQVVSAAQVGESRSFVFAGYRDPLVVGAPLTWGIDGFYRYEQLRFFVNHRRVLQVPTLVGGGEAELGWVLSRHLHALIGFSARYQRVYAAEVEVPDVSLPAYNPRSGRIFRLVFKVRYDNTVSPEGLPRGVRLLVKNEISDQFWGCVESLLGDAGSHHVDPVQGCLGRYAVRVTRKA